MTLLDELMARDYEISLRHIGGKYYARVVGLELVASGSSVEEAHSALRETMRRHFQDHMDMGNADRIPLPREAHERQELTRQLKPFFVKTAMVALVGTLLIVAANVSIVYTLRETPKRLAQTVGRAFIHQFVNKLDKFARQEITPAREEKIHQALRNVVPRLQPYMRDLAPLFDQANLQPPESKNN